MPKYICEISTSSWVYYKEINSKYFTVCLEYVKYITIFHAYCCGYVTIYEGWNFNSGNYLFTTDTK